ncbi:MAG: ribosomal RNA small subunit methyltransferase A [Kiritimatiellae bacterium]|nr:ribosomal RNA small subunit methyltransferase A [Kiritimatiellia bacterium]
MLNLTSPKAVVELLKSNEITPNKVLGQNFLIDRNILDSIVEVSETSSEYSVLEVGPGLGVLTEQLMLHSKHVTAVEKDSGLYRILSERWGKEEKLTLIHGDALEVPLHEIYAAGTTRLISNLPYSVGVRVVLDSALCDNPPEVMVLLLQKEVCERFAAKPGTADMGIVSVLLQRLYKVTLVRNVKPTCFYPQPDVTSTIVKLKRHNDYPMDAVESKYFTEFVKLAFSHRRKQLASVMKNAPAPYGKSADEIRMLLLQVGATETARPEELSISQWVQLSSLWRNS